MGVLAIQYDGPNMPKCSWDPRRELRFKLAASPAGAENGVARWLP